MSYINDRVFDFGLNVLDTEANRLDICHTEPSTYTQATSTYSVGNKTGLSVGSPAAGSPNGRQVTIPAITDGVVTSTSTGSADDAQYFAITDTVNSRLLLAGPLAAAQMVTSGNTFTLTSFTYRQPSA